MSGRIPLSTITQEWEVGECSFCGNNVCVYKRFFENLLELGLIVENDVRTFLNTIKKNEHTE